MTDNDVVELEEFVNKLISDLQSMDVNEARDIATQTLIRTGVLNEDGSHKEQIVTGDFFGW